MIGSFFVLISVAHFDFVTPSIGYADVYDTKYSCERAMKERAFDLIARDPELQADQEFISDGYMSLEDKDRTKGHIFVCQEIFPPTTF